VSPTSPDAGDPHVPGRDVSVNTVPTVVGQGSLVRTTVLASAAIPFLGQRIQSPRASIGLALSNARSTRDSGERRDPAFPGS
jgi:ABC-type dipeptide/oligopeptide/nickel transport system permease subunit